MSLSSLLQKYRNIFLPVIKVEASESLAAIDLSPNNPELTNAIFENTQTFCDYINRKRREKNADYLIGGYGERREIYRRSGLFDDNLLSEVKEEPRNIHLGIDVWCDAGTKIYCPYDATIHSFAFNDNFGDYGATIILQHRVEGIAFHTLYGHLALSDLSDLYTGKPVKAGEPFAHFGAPVENGHWPPHLHFQVIQDMLGMQGDFPGVCKTSEKEIYLQNSPDAEFILNLDILRAV